MQTTVTEKPSPETLLVNAKDAAKLCGISPATWHRLTAKGANPAAVRLSGAVRWKRSDLELWVTLGCPERSSFESISADERRRSRR